MQELFLHALPLIAILIFNCHTEKQYGKFDLTCIVMLGINALQLMIEILLLPVFKLKDIDLELRWVLNSEERDQEVSNLCCLAFLFALVVFIFGLTVKLESCSLS